MDRTFGVWPSDCVCMRVCELPNHLLAENNGVFSPKREREHMRPNRIIQATYINRKSCTDSSTSVAFQSIEAFFAPFALLMVALEI